MQTHEAAGRGLRPLLSLIRRGRTSALVAALVFMAGLPLVWIKGQSRYSAEAVFQVWPYFQKNLSLDKEFELQSNSQYREMVNHLSRSALRFDVVEQALVKLQKEKVTVCLPAETQRKCIERLQRTMYVLPVADTYMVRLGMESDQREGLDKIINAIMERFLETTKSEQLFGADERTVVLVQRRATLIDEMTRFEQVRNQLAGRLGLTTFGENTTNPYDSILAQAREKLTLASIERSQAQATLEAYQSQRETPVSAGRSVLELRLQDNGLQALRNEVIKRSEELGRTLAGLEARHPAYQPTVSEQNALKQRMQTSEDAADKVARQNVQSRLMASVQQTQQVEKQLRARVADIEGQATGFATDFREAMRLTREIRKREQELDDLRNRINYIDNERGAIGFVRSITPAFPPETPQGIGHMRLMLALLAVSLAVALVLPMALDMVDRRILTVGDAERAMGIASAAWFVGVEDEPTRRLAQDQSRRLASTLLRNRARGARGVFGFSSVKLGGSAMLMLDLAHTLQQLGSRVLVVDGNSMATRSPLASEEVGLSDLLAGDAAPELVVHAQAHQGGMLPVVPLGRCAERGIQRLDVLRQAIDRWSSEFDLVLMEVPPLLLSADAELMIDVIGQVFMVVEAGEVTRGEVTQARAQLQKIDPGAVGLIVTAMPMQSAESNLKEQMVESITRERFQRVMSTSYLRLQLELLRLRLSQWWHRH